MVMVPSKGGGGGGDRHDDDHGDTLKKCNKRRRSSAQELSQSLLIPCTNKYTTSFHHHRLLTKVARESTVPSTKSIVIVPRHQYPRADFINDAANATERETEVEILSAEQQQQQRSQFWTKQLSQRRIIYNMDQLPTVRSGFTVPQLSHYPYTEGRRGGDLFNTTITEHFNNNATTLTTATKDDDNLLLAQQQEAHQQPQSISQQTLNGRWQRDKDVDDRRKMIAMM